MLVAGIAAVAAVVVASIAITGDTGELLTRNTIRLALVWYFLALLLMIRLDPRGWEAATTVGRLARWCWTWGIICFVIHVAMAFHFYHHWSHADAFERTRQISGLGEGIYFSYLFGIIWLADAVFWWLSPARYAGRPRWIDRSLHGFMLFMVFNGTIVFESGPVRWVSAAALALVLSAWIAHMGVTESG